MIVIDELAELREELERLNAEKKILKEAFWEGVKKTRLIDADGADIEQLSEAAQEVIDDAFWLEQNRIETRIAELETDEEDEYRDEVRFQYFSGIKL